MLTDRINSLLARLGIRVVRTSRYGIDPWYDIKKIADALQISIECAFDVGAHEGVISSKILRQFQRCSLFAFEPSPETFAKLTKSDRFFPYRLALSDAVGMGTLHTYSDSKLNSLSANARFAIHRGDPPRQVEVEVEVGTVDAFCVEHGIQRIDILKIDAEGCDLKVLLGARKMLRSTSFVYIEFNDLAEKVGSIGGALLPIGDYLSRSGFHFVASYPEITDFEHGGHIVVANALLFNPSAYSIC